jgi:hypothetical protein
MIDSNNQEYTQELTLNILHHNMVTTESSFVLKYLWTCNMFTPLVNSSASIKCHSQIQEHPVHFAIEATAQS